jgi:RNAse (barnase) inhibitor barstar
MSPYFQRKVNPWVDVEAGIDWLPTSPYLLTPDRLTPTVQRLEFLGFQVVRVNAGALAPDLEDSLLIELSKALSFSPLGAGHWGAFSDRLWDLLTAENKQPVAVLIEDFDHVLRADFHTFVRIVHKLLSLTEDLGMNSETEADRQVEYFFLGLWPN